MDNILAQIVEWRMKEAKAAGKVKNPTAYEQAVTADVETLRPKAEQAVAKFDAPVHTLAAYVDGRRDARWIKRHEVAG